MDLDKKYMSKYLHDAAIAQLVDEYKTKGYQVNTEEKLGGYRADIIARKDNEQLVIEVKSGEMTPVRRNELAGIANYINEIGGYKFHVVIANPPKVKEIQIEGIEELITEYVFSEPPDELDELSTHSRPDEVYGVKINNIKITKGLIKVEGIGIIRVELQYGSDKDQERGDGFKTNDKFPFEFNLDLEFYQNEWTIGSINKFKVDTTSFYI